MYANANTLSDHLRNTHGILPWTNFEGEPEDNDDGDVSGEIGAFAVNLTKCKVCEEQFQPAEMENHLRYPKAENLRCFTQIFRMAVVFFYLDSATVLCR